ncbi:MAG: DUF4168 domain-containing protein [Legionellaceae bacterium]|nr:DUF4168 domain-containing protein [Legionellaceae bacterium]
MKNILIVLSMLAGFSLPLLATADTPQATTNASQAGNAQIEDADLKKFVLASKAISQIQQKYQTEMQGETDQQKAQSLQQQAHTDMTKAIIDNGLTLEEYNKLAQTIQQDPELVKKIQTMM